MVVVSDRWTWYGKIGKIVVEPELSLYKVSQVVVCKKR